VNDVSKWGLQDLRQPRFVLPFRTYEAAMLYYNSEFPRFALPAPYVAPVIRQSSIVGGGVG